MGSHFEFHFGSPAGTELGAEHSIDGVKAAMEMHAVFYKNELTSAQETAAADAAADLTLTGVAAATPTGANGGYNRAVIGATTAPVDPAGVAVVAYQIDVGDSNPELTVLTPLATTSVNMSMLMMLGDGALEDYYYYDGSL